METMESNRIAWIDMAKGLTIFLVVFHHAFMGAKNLGLVSSSVFELYELSRPFRMPLFFLVAGLFTKSALQKPFTVFARQKLLYFLYFYVLWNTISVVIRASLSSYTNNQVEYSDVFYLLWEPTFNLWFLYGLLLAFFSLYVLMRFGGVVILTSFCLLCISYEVSGLASLPFIFKATIMLFPFFAIGTIFSAALIEYIDQKANLVVFILLSILCISADFYIKNEYWDSVFYYLSALVYAITMLTLMKRLQKTVLRGVLLYIGQHSLSIYLMHFLPVAAANFMLIRQLDMSQPLLTSTISSVVTVALCIWGFKVLNSNKYLRYLVKSPLLRERQQADL
ncbi:acyltransferase [Glaciecola sp. MH2013]|uniref:acyltransferase family protein n=1 Tax=Glaciecola sp. MH2013 TaxID=2785524 RepID=UPI001DDCFC64|nr:acyltransferase [Glaciecola sp. MH2013]MBF7073558.1 acyltransferase [Glaciecola sp. MH2013]